MPDDDDELLIHVSCRMTEEQLAQFEEMFNRPGPSQRAILLPP